MYVTRLLYDFMHEYKEKSDHLQRYDKGCVEVDRAENCDHIFAKISEGGDAVGPNPEFSRELLTVGSRDVVDWGSGCGKRREEDTFVVSRGGHRLRDVGFTEEEDYAEEFAEEHQGGLEYWVWRVT